MKHFVPLAMDTYFRGDSDAPLNSSFRFILSGELNTWSGLPSFEKRRFICEVVDNCELPLTSCSIHKNCTVRSCKCFDGFHNENCDVDELLYPCVSQPCLHDSECVSSNSNYHCKCVQGWSGGNCEQDFNECLSNPCKNGGICSNSDGSFNCECVEGFSGSDCDVNIDDCKDEPCLNGGECIDGHLSYNCSCPSGYHGHNCQEYDAKSFLNISLLLYLGCALLLALAFLLIAICVRYVCAKKRRDAATDEWEEEPPSDDPIYANKAMIDAVAEAPDERTSYRESVVAKETSMIESGQPAAYIQLRRGNSVMSGGAQEGHDAGEYEQIVNLTA